MGGAPRLEVGGGGWTRWVDPDLVVDILIRFAFTPGDARAQPVEVHAITTGEDGTSGSRGIGATLRRLPWGKIEAVANAPATRSLLRARVDEPPGLREWQTPAAARIETDLHVPSGGRYPDSFYLRFVEAYTALAARGDAPAVVLSEANGVARTTVHRWAKEARRRGLLSPGTRGRAG